MKNQNKLFSVTLPVGFLEPKYDVVAGNANETLPNYITLNCNERNKEFAH